MADIVERLRTMDMADGGMVAVTAGVAAADLLEAGIYTIPEAAFLVRASEQKVRGWVGDIILAKPTR